MYLVLHWSLEFRIDDVSTVGHYKHPDPVGFGRAPDIAPLHISPLSRRVEGARHVDEGFSICRARGNDAKQVVLKAIMVQCLLPTNDATNRHDFTISNDHMPCNIKQSSNSIVLAHGKLHFTV